MLLILFQLFTFLQPTVILQVQNDYDNSSKESSLDYFTRDDFPGHKLRVKRNIDLCDSVNQMTGYLDVEEDGEKDSYFFWFFESRSKPKTDPLVLWLNGGPGCSSFTGLLMELGPCKVSRDGKSTVLNPFSWNQESNLIFLDQPVGTGFSHGTSRVKSSQKAAKNVYAFLQILFYHHPQYAESAFHLAGESYAGHYIPEIAKVIINRSSDESSSKINLESVLIGNGIVDALVQNKYYADMAEDSKYGPILPKSEIKRMRRSFPKCKRMVSKCYQTDDAKICRNSARYCAQVNFLAFDWLTDLSPYDIRKKSNYYDKNDKLIEKFLNQRQIQEKLGVSRKFAGCSDKVFDDFDHFGDESRNVVKDVPLILHAGVRVLVYAGDADFICNWIGNKAWTDSLDWSGSKGYQNAPSVAWMSAGKQAGELKSFENLAFLRIFEAGHFVPFDQPEVSLDFFKSWINGELEALSKDT